MISVSVEFFVEYIVIHITGAEVVAFTLQSNIHSTTDNVGYTCYLLW